MSFLIALEQDTDARLENRHKWKPHIFISVALTPVT
jgi:hypothetical protein